MSLVLLVLGVVGVEDAGLLLLVILRLVVLLRCRGAAVGTNV